MTAAAVAGRRGKRQGLLTVRPLRDMAPLADLIEAAFGHELDAEGRRLIREMRSFGRAGLLGWLAGRFVLPPAAYPKGYVWYQAGRLVGNASVLPVEAGSPRWVLANVAVQPEFRRRGIARGMVQACLGLAQDQGGQEMILQVERDNEAAIRLYRELGFLALTERTTYRRRSGTPAPEDPDLGLARAQRPEEWHHQFQLARAEHPEGVVWPMPVRADLFRGAGWMAPRAGRNWVWFEGDRLLGSLTARPDWDREAWRFVLVAAGSGRGRVERGLISLALVHLGEVSNVVIDYPTSVAAADLDSLGFHAERTLTWMGKSLS
ncbi:MAG: GNAT family N-acetyltransferase [Anaerolineales bacterium]